MGLVPFQVDVVDESDETNQFNRMLLTMIVNYHSSKRLICIMAFQKLIVKRLELTVVSEPRASGNMKKNF